MYQLLPIKYELKLPSEATPTSFAIQNQIQAVWRQINYEGEFYRAKIRGIRKEVKEL